MRSTATIGQVAASPRTRARSGWRRLALVLAIVLPALLIVAYLGVSAYVANELSHPKRSPIERTPPQYGLQYEDVEFNSTDGILLRGWYLDSPGHAAILMMHGREGVRDGPPAMDIAKLLVGHGYDVFMFDFRAHGTSEGERYSLGQWEVRDVAGALDYLQKRGVPRIGAFATSMGGAAELKAAVDHPEMVALVADSSFADLPALLEVQLPKASHLPVWFNPGISLMLKLMYGIDLEANKPVQVIPQLGARPIFLIHSEQDEMIPSWHTLRLQEAGAANPNLTAWIAPGVGHCRAFMNNEEEYSKRLVEFYDRYMR